MLTGSLLYENLNAKNSSHEKVAESFVANSDFYEITKDCHTVVLGPRGCGKTTMFKMLTTPALRTWNPTEERDQIVKENIPFVAIYIPSDELWKKQLESLSDNVRQEDISLLEAVTNALITCNILVNYCFGIAEHIQYTYRKDEEKDREFARNLCNSWKLSDTANDFSAIRQSLDDRKNELIAKLTLAKTYTTGRMEVSFEASYFLDFIMSIRSACTAFERIYENSKQLKWALCFDELELVSKQFFESMVDRLRVSPPNLLFKLSTGPLANFKLTDALQMHDYNVVKMWPYNLEKEKSYQKFCEEIAIKRIIKYGGNQGLQENITTLEKIFGKLDYNLLALKKYNFAIDTNANESDKFSLTWHAFKKLAELDPGFEYFLRTNRIDSENPVARNKNINDTIIRKIKEIVINRLVFMRYKTEDQGSDLSAQQTRKVFPIYYGSKTILNMCEGNPRFMIGMITDLITDKSLHDSSNDYKILPLKQAKKIKEISDRFYSMVTNYQSVDKFTKNKNLDLEWLIDCIGTYFQKEINSGPVKINPISSFTVDDTLPTDIYKLITIGAGLGAFIKLDSDGNLTTNSDRNTRFRLSYLLAPKYKLPLRLYGMKSLQNIISESNNEDQLKLY